MSPIHSLIPSFAFFFSSGSDRRDYSYNWHWEIAPMKLKITQAKRLETKESAIYETKERWISWKKQQTNAKTKGLKFC